MMKKIFFALFFIMIFCIHISAYGASYEVTLFDLDSSSAIAINNNGVVTGSYLKGDGYSGSFVYNNSSYTYLGTLKADDSGKCITADINDSNQVVGHSHYDGESGIDHAFIWNESSGMTDLGTLRSDNLGYAYAKGINNSGQVVGLSFFSTTIGYYHAAIWDGNQKTDLGTLRSDDSGDSRAYDINSAGTVVVGRSSYAGSGNVWSDFHAYRWSEGIMLDLGTLRSDNNGVSQAFKLNEAGQIIGTSEYIIGDTTRHAFIWDETNGMVDMGTLRSDDSGESFAANINEAGTIVGNSEFDESGDSHAFIYENGVMTDLNSLIDPDSGWVLMYATDINDLSVIVGTGLYNGEQKGFILTATTPIPEPGSCLLLVMGLAELIHKWFRK